MLWWISKHKRHLYSSPAISYFNRKQRPIKTLRKGSSERQTQLLAKSPSRLSQWLQRCVWQCLDFTNRKRIQRRQIHYCKIHSHNFVYLLNLNRFRKRTNWAIYSRNRCQPRSEKSVLLGYWRFKKTYSISESCLFVDANTEKCGLGLKYMTD